MPNELCNCGHDKQHHANDRRCYMWVFATGYPCSCINFTLSAEYVKRTYTEQDLHALKSRIEGLKIQVP
jgi:hypothetical protein